MSKHPVRRHRPPPAVMWQCTALPLWVRVGLYAQGHHGTYHRPGHLRALLGTDAPALSRAIARAKREGLVTHDSSARKLWTLVRP